MQLILEIEESEKDIVLNIISNLKEGLIKKLKVLESPYVNAKEQKDIEDILNARTDDEKDIAYSKTISIDIQFDLNMKKDIKITYLKKAVKFLDKNRNTIKESDVDSLMILAIRKKIFLEDISLDIKELKGSLLGKSRVRKGKVRIIFEILVDEIIIESIVEDIDFRGNIY